MVDSRALSRWQRLLLADNDARRMQTRFTVRSVWLELVDPVDWQLDICIGSLDLPEAYFRLPSSESR